MHRIDTPTAQIDKFGPGKNGFTNGDPATGRRATDLNSDMWDAVQEEMANAIEGNGIELDKSKHNQLYLAIQKAITDPGFLKKANNLSDLANVAEARGNLQLGTAATKNVGSATGNVMSVGAFGLGVGPQHKADAFSDLAQIYRINASSASTPGGSVYGVICLPCDGAPSAAYLAAGNNGELHVGRSTTASKGVTWARVYTAAYKPTTSDINAVNKSGDRMSGPLGTTYADSYRIVSRQYGTFWRNDGNALYLMLTNAGDQWGTFNNLRPFAVSTSDGSINVGTSFSVNYTGYINKLGVNHYTSNGQSFNQTNGLHIQGAGDQYGDIYYLETVGKYGSLSFHIHGGGLDAYPAFNNNGSLSLNGSWPAITNSSGTTWHPDGNVEGPQWGGYLSNWLNKNISNAQNNAQNWAYQNLVQNVRLTGRINQPDTGGQVRVPDGCVFTGMSGANYDPSIWASYSYVQVLINGSWRNIGTS